MLAALVAAPCLFGDVSLGSIERASGAVQSGAAEPADAEAFATFEQRFVFTVALMDSSDLTISPEAGLPKLTEEPTPPPRPMVTMAQFCDALTAAAESNNLPVSFFARLIWQESNFKFDEVSHVGAQGVAQFMPETATEVGLDDPFDPLKALPASARLLRKLRDQLGNIGLAAAAYNAGPGRIQNWLARRSSLPDETRNYVRRITGNVAESWTTADRRLTVPRELPPDAPCVGFGGLSSARDAMAVPVELAPEIRGLLEKVKEAAMAARRKAAEARQRLARRGKAGHARKGATIARAATGHRIDRGRAPTRLASAER
ncbi:lytic transglycosylase domain-containing protein [Bradyrhizobium sp. WD16]|uniref:lytic transglycosylase domain-containing protein n=1 Tax=Bradyrhizobium sp. WD16 TaxID=1521768 RepID=UPI0020A46F41|nr:lytic transglycosylase domain-containing protein [Bradyrhizobium sp. WD16]